MYVCKTMRLCSYLLSQGFKVKRERIDRENPKYKVWEFEQSPQLWAAITRYSTRDKNY